MSSHELVYVHMGTLNVCVCPFTLHACLNFCRTTEEHEAERERTKLSSSLHLFLVFLHHVTNLVHKDDVMDGQPMEGSCNFVVHLLCCRNYMNDSLRTNVFVRFEAETIACACIYLAARVLQVQNRSLSFITSSWVHSEMWC